MCRCSPPASHRCTLWVCVVVVCYFPHAFCLSFFFLMCCVLWCGAVRTVLVYLAVQHTAVVGDLILHCCLQTLRSTVPPPPSASASASVSAAAAAGGIAVSADLRVMCQLSVDLLNAPLDAVSFALCICVIPLHQDFNYFLKVLTPFLLWPRLRRSTARFRLICFRYQCKCCSPGLVSSYFSLFPLISSGTLFILPFFLFCTHTHIHPK